MAEIFYIMMNRWLVQCISLEVEQLLVHSHLHLSQSSLLPPSRSNGVMAVLKSAESTC